MTAGNRNIIIEKGADFTIKTKLKVNSLTAKDLRGELPIGSNKLGEGTTTDRDNSTPATNDYWYETDGVTSDIINVWKYTGTWVDANADLVSWTGDFRLYYDDAGSVTEEVVANTFTVTDGVNGAFSVHIDEAVTDTLLTRVTSANPFITEYRYFYHIEINNTNSGEDLRVLRGKCAVRV